MKKTRRLNTNSIYTVIVYTIAILAAAFLAGLTMRYWMITGEYLIDELLK